MPIVAEGYLITALLIENYKIQVHATVAWKAFDVPKTAVILNFF